MQAAGGRFRQVGRLGGVIAFLVCATPAHAEQPADYTNRGDGGITCAKWTSYRKTAGADDITAYPALSASNWVLGYLTAYDRYVDPSGNVGAGVDNDSIAAWVDTYCAAHPLDSLATAADHLIEALKTRNR